MISSSWVRRVAAVCLVGSSGAALAAGTSLSVVFTADPVVACHGDGTGADVSFAWTATSSGAADAATVTGQIDGGDVVALPGIASGNAATGGGWTFAGRIKTADGSYTASVPNGDHSFTVCVAQSGSNGNPDKTACTTQQFAVNCQSADLCANARVFGEVPANKNLCSANGRIQVQFGGNYGENATLTISGPTVVDDEPLFKRVDSVSRAGDSCNYHFNWDPHDLLGNDGAGTYKFSVAGNGNSNEWSADLACSEGNGGGGGGGKPN